MWLAVLLLLLAGVFPIVVAVRANRRTSLLHAVLWGAACWVAWIVVHLLAAESADLLRYVALCLTGCTVVAVLGARRPHLTAWNFVVLSFLAVMLLPLLERAVLGEAGFDLRVLLLQITILLGVVNYLPTRVGWAALLAAAGAAGQFAIFRHAGALGEAVPLITLASMACLGLAPWAALWSGRPAPPRSDIDRLWRDFRNRFGLVWGLRVREQFNRAAANSGWPVQLSWRGLQFHGSLDPATEQEIGAALQALLKRFT